MHDYDTDVSSGGLRLGSDGFAVLAGVTLSGQEKLTGEAAIGYQRQDLDEPGFGDVDAFLARAQLLWEASALTTVSFSAETEIEETVTGTDGAYPVYTLRAGVAHALRRNLIVSAGVGSEFADDSTTVDFEAAAEYALNRSVAVVGDVSHSYTRDDDGGEHETTVTMGMRLQR